MNADDRRHVLRLMSHGLYVVGANGAEEPVANAVTWLTQCSLKPPLVAVAIRSEGRLHDAIEESQAFSVNVVGRSQQELVAAFFRPSEVQGGKINDYVFESGPQTDAPLLLAAPAWFEARVKAHFAEGDHTVYIAEVVEAGVRDAEAQPLMLSDTPWSYGG